MGGGSKRDLAKERFWRKAIARLAASNMSPGQFCKQEGLDPDLLRYWRGAILKRDAALEAEVPHEPAAGRRFVPVVVTGQDYRLPGTRPISVAEIIFDGGSVSLFNGITIDTVRALLLAVRDGVN